MEYVIKSLAVIQSGTYKHASLLLFQISNMKCDVKFKERVIWIEYLSVTRSKYDEHIFKNTTAATKPEKCTNHMKKMGVEIQLQY